MKKLGMTFIVVVGFGFTGIAQEYDDLYFNSSDRKKAKQELQEEQERQSELQVAQQYQSNYSDNYTSTEVDPALIEEYRQQAEELRLQYLSPYNSANQFVNENYGDEPLDFQYTGQYGQDDLLYQEEFQDQGNTIINNYYGGTVNPGWNGGFGNGGWGNGWGAGWGMGIGWGWNSWGMYDPFWNPWYYNSWYGFGWNMYSPYFGGGRGWGYNPWRWGYHPYYDNGWFYIAPNTTTKQYRDVNRGPRMDRGGNVVNNTGQNRPIRNMAESTTTRDFSRTQANYLNQARGTGSPTQPYTSGGVTSYGNRNPTRGTVNQTAARPNYSRSGTANETSGGTRTNSYQIRPSKNLTNSQNRNINYQQQGNPVNQNRSYAVPGQTINRSGQQRPGTFQLPNTQRANQPAVRQNQSSNSGSRNSGNVNRSQGSTNRSSGGTSSGGSRSSGGSSSGGSSGGSSRGGGGRGGR